MDCITQCGLPHRPAPTGAMEVVVAMAVKERVAAAMVAMTQTRKDCQMGTAFRNDSLVPFRSRSVPFLWCHAVVWGVREYYDPDSAPPDRPADLAMADGWR